MTLREQIQQLIVQYEDEALAPAQWEMSNAFLLRTVAIELRDAVRRADAESNEDVK